MTKETTLYRGIDAPTKIFLENFKNLLTLPLTVMIDLTCKEEIALFPRLQNQKKGRNHV